MLLKLQSYCYTDLDYTTSLLARKYFLLLTCIYIYSINNTICDKY